MNILSTVVLFAVAASTILLTECEQASGENKSPEKETPKPAFAGFGSQVKWGEHLVTVSACHDCHTPKRMTDHGPDLDSSLLLSGHPSQLEAANVDRQELESKGVTATTHLTS